MASHYLRKYGVQTTIPFELYETDGTDLKTDAVHASGDTKIMKDEAAEANTTNGFVDEGQGYSITVTNTEMQAARIVIYIVDQGTKAWLDKVLIIDTYGNASAQHAFDLDTATVNLSSTTETQIDAIETDTNELQTDWTNGGRLDNLLDARSTHAAADVWAVGTRGLTDKAGFSLSAAGIDSIIDEVIEGTTTLRQAIKLLTAALVGKSSGGGTATLKFRDIGDSKDRITATVDANGNRTAMTLDAT